MDIKKCYQSIEGDYDGTVARLCSEALLGRLLVKYLDDKAAADLNAAVDNKDCEAAFKAVHTMKGTALNLGFTKLAASASALTEKLRGCAAGALENSLDLYQEVVNNYNDVVAAIKDNM